MSIERLNIIIQKTLPLVYDDSLSYLEFLAKVVAKVNEAIDELNIYLNQDLRSYVEQKLIEWKNDGTLDNIISESILDIGNRQYTEENYVTNLETITNSIDNLDMALKDRTLINVKDFGAVGNGVDDDTIAIQYAINTGSIYIPDGVYMISNAIKIPSGRLVKGESFNTKLRLASYANVGSNVLQNADYINGNNNIIIKNLFIDGNRANRQSATGSAVIPGHSGVVLAHTEKSVIENVFVVSTTLHGINITADNEIYAGATGYKSTGSKDIIIKSCFVTDCGDDGITTHYSNGVTISDCICWDMAAVFSTSSNGIEIDDGSEDINISGCVCYNTNKYNSETNKKTYNGIETHGHENSPAPRRVNITNCVVWNCYRGINFAHFTYDQFGGAYSPTAENVSVTNCTVKDCVNTGIRVTSYKGFTITGNTTDQTGEHGAIRASGNARFGTISSNVIRNSESGNYAIRCWGSDSLTINNNVIEGRNKRGIYPTNNSSVVGNRINSILPKDAGGATTGVYVSPDIGNLVLIGNVINGFQTNINDVSGLHNVEHGFNIYDADYVFVGDEE